MSTKFSPIQSKLHELLNVLINEDSFLKENIVSVYGIGSLAKNKAKIGDLDLNIFSKDISYNALLAIELMFDKISKNMNMAVDVNIVDMNQFDYNIASSDLFTHKNRHSLFLYELKTVKCLMYGIDILETITIKHSDLITEGIKLAATLVQRLNKDFLTSGKKSAMKQAKKFSKYACEFALIAKGIQNPYLETNETLFCEHFSKFKDMPIVKSIWADEPWDDKLLDQSYNFILELSHILIDRYKLLVTKQYPEKAVIIGNALHHTDAWFVFKNQEDFDDFFKVYDSQPDHRKIR
jgi:hypothetical protein